METINDVLPKIDEKDIPPMPPKKAAMVSDVQLVTVADDDALGIKVCRQIYDHQIERQMSAECPPELEGVTFAGLVIAAARLGMRIEITDLNFLPL
ncbi:MAG: hypothetical protein WC551_11070 [Patescibacteria group bacterium]